jgi:hypothetical protein
MDDETKESLAVVLGYLWGDEEKHYEEDDRPAGHVFEHVLRLDAWLKRQ